MPPEKAIESAVGEGKMGDFYEKGHNNFDKIMFNFDSFVEKTRNNLISFLKSRGTNKKRQKIINLSIEKIKKVKKIYFVNRLFGKNGEVSAQANTFKYTVKLNKYLISKIDVNNLEKELTALLVHELLHISGLDKQQEIRTYYTQEYNLKLKGDYKLTQEEVIVRTYNLLLFIHKNLGLKSGKIGKKDIDEIYNYYNSFPEGIQVLLDFYSENKKKYQLLELLNDGLAKNDLDNRLESDLEQIA